ncbi:LIM and senescent cell antigen-like-containing domain protein 2 [Kappamyces sp. JEL0829]|nr:LIM and senescent cell antigen-like-containing domain protein 2 [Kappamyces sp. JEL0829]
MSAQLVQLATTAYHPECFRCHHCLRCFPDNVFFETEDGIYCEADYNLLCLARCGKCAEVIMGKCINALDAKWHIEHFCCENCGRSLVGASFVRKDDKPYCKLCPTDTERAKIKKLDEATDSCEFCNKPIEKYPLLFKGGKYHAYHYHCHVCQKQLDHTAREYAGELYCFPDYEKIQSKICGACRKPIMGNTVSALGKVFHPEHFVCFQCENPFNGTTHYEHKNHPYCELHYKQVTGAICQYCRKAVKGNAIDALGGKWCENHFQCLGCFVNLSDLQRTSFLDFDGKPFCRRCYDSLPWGVRSNLKSYREKEKKYA